MNQREKGALLLLLGLCLLARTSFIEATTIEIPIPVGVLPPDSDYSVYWDESGYLIRDRIVIPIIKDEDMRAGLLFPTVEIPQGTIINSATLSLYFDLYLDEASEEDMSLMISVWGYASGAPPGATLSNFDPNSLVLGAYATNVNLTGITSPQWVDIDVTDQVQLLINNWHWESGWSLPFIIYSAEQPTWRAYQSNVGLRVPKLEITYGETPPGGGEEDTFIDQYRGADIWLGGENVLYGARFVVYDNPNSTLYILDKFTPNINRTINLPRYCGGSILETGEDWYYIAKQTDGTGTALNRVYNNGTVIELGELQNWEIEYDAQNNRLLFNETTNTFHTFFQRTSNLGFYYQNATLINGSLSVGPTQDIEIPLALQYGGVGSWVDVVEVKGYIYGSTDCAHSGTTRELMLFYCEPSDHDFARRLVDNAYLTGTRGRCYVVVLEEIDQIYFFRRMNDFSGTSDNALWVSEIPFSIGDPVNTFDDAFNYSQWEDFSYLSRTGAPAIYMEENNGTVTVSCVSQERVTNYINIQTWYDYQMGEGRGDQDYASGDITTLPNVISPDLYEIANRTKMILCDTTTDIYYNIPRNDTNIWDWGGTFTNVEIGDLSETKFDLIKKVSGSPGYYIIINGTIYQTNCTNIECVKAQIDEILGGSDPDDPSPPGSDWEETGYFTRGKMRLYFFVIGMSLFWLPLFYMAWAVKGGMKLVFVWVILVCWMIAFALLWSIPSI